MSTGTSQAALGTICHKKPRGLLPKPSSTSPLKTDNVQMNNVLPGWIEGLPSTGGRRDSMSMKRCGTSEETAATCLASEGAGYITGPARTFASWRVTRAV